MSGKRSSFQVLRSTFYEHRHLTKASVSEQEIFSVASEEVMAVAQFLELKTMHIFGHGFGAAVALDVASKQQSIPVKSIVLESPTLQGGTEKEIR
mmetsp:Transcript_9214/g.40295  ORF Transcript_9214/g.40295 Transcript_9214/m.40295 type:complete len:95 (-) Transcript_9214:58-342(-)